MDPSKKGIIYWIWWALGPFTLGCLFWSGGFVALTVGTLKGNPSRGFSRLTGYWIIAGLLWLADLSLLTMRRVEYAPDRVHKVAHWTWRALLILGSPLAFWQITRAFGS